MKITVQDKTKKKAFKKGDVFQGISGTLYQIIQDENNKYRALDLKRCEVRHNVRDTANALVDSFSIEEGIHHMYEDIEMVLN